MAGLMGGLELGKRALATHQLWLNTIGHNIANVNTPGYTRQRVNIATTYPFEHPVGPMGTGVMATGIEHIRDLFLNQQYRAENKSLGNWAAMEKTLSQIEALFSEPSDDSLNGLLNDFWNSWSAMEPDSENSGGRSALRGTANLLAAGFHRIYNQLMDIRKSIDNDVTLTIEKVNIISDELASLNLQIARYESGGDRANDLRDKRDNLIDQLSEYIDVNVRENENGTATVYVGALAIVDGDSSFRIGTQKSAAGNITVGDIVWEGTSKEIKILNGQLKALLDVRDKLIPKYIEALDDLAETLITSVNELHRNGYGLDGSTGLNFFDTASMSAADIKLSSAIERDVNRIALSLSGEVGDNRNALAISELRFAKLMQRGTRTVSEYYQAMIGEIGVTTGEAKHLKENYELLVAQIDNARQSVQGVSLDEEMTQMIKFQHAFDAASRVITAMDQALDTVINEMGVVGR